MLSCSHYSVIYFRKIRDNLLVEPLTFEEIKQHATTGFAYDLNDPLGEQIGTVAIESPYVNVETVFYTKADELYNLQMFCENLNGVMVEKDVKIISPDNNGNLGKVSIYLQYLITPDQREGLLCYLSEKVKRKPEIVIDEDGFNCNSFKE